MRGSVRRGIVQAGPFGLLDYLERLLREQIAAFDDAEAHHRIRMFWCRPRGRLAAAERSASDAARVARSILAEHAEIIHFWRRRYELAEDAPPEIRERALQALEDATRALFTGTSYACASGKHHHCDGMRLATAGARDRHCCCRHHDGAKEEGGRAFVLGLTPSRQCASGDHRYCRGLAASSDMKVTICTCEHHA